MAKLQSNQREERARSNARAVLRAHAALEQRAAARGIEAPDPVVLRSLVGAKPLRDRIVQPSRQGRSLVLAALPGPAYTLSPEPMTQRPILDTQKRPRSVWSALLTLDGSTYLELVRLAFGCTRAEARGTLVDSLLFEATQTARFEPRPGGGWNVWIDRQGRARVEVHP